MASNLADIPVPLPDPDSSRSIFVPDFFEMAPVDPPKSTISSRVAAQTPIAPPAPSKTDEADFPFGPLGVLGRFVGKFQGIGFNMIFRPNDGFTEANRVPNETMLQLNMTFESLEFLPGSTLDDIPNRGFDDQKTVMLTGVPYTQKVMDLYDENAKTLKPLPGGPGIHFEQGLFLRTPRTTNPAVDPSIARLASIPHGTTINAQGLESTKVVTTKPGIPDISITPFEIGKPLSASNFTTMFNGADTVPQNMAAARKIFTQQLQANPNKLLQDANANRNIINHITFTVSTESSTSGVPGGGVANIAFLTAQKPKLNPAGIGNAVAASTTCTYWISTVQSKLTIPAGNWDQQPADKFIQPDEATTAGIWPWFKVSLNKKVTSSMKIDVTWTQIQYSQKVLLDFGTLSWPHISVATLVASTREAPLIIPADSPFLASLK